MLGCVALFLPCLCASWNCLYSVGVSGVRDSLSGVSCGAPLVAPSHEPCVAGDPRDVSSTPVVSGEDGQVASPTPVVRQGSDMIDGGSSGIRVVSLVIDVSIFTLCDLGAWVMVLLRAD